MTAPATLEEIRDLDAGVAYPGHLLRGRETALVVFAAGFYGRQDAYWIADAGLTATCVDNDKRFLAAMQPVYPDDWQFVCADAFDFADRTGEMWDVVSVDAPSNLFAECAAVVQSWCDLARHAVVLGTGAATVVVAPDGWLVTETRRRSDFLGGVYWTVLERA